MEYTNRTTRGGALDIRVAPLAFTFLVALERLQHLPCHEGLREGSAAAGGMLQALSAAGGVITSAGVVLATVYAVLGVVPPVVLAQLGIVIGVGIGVLIDALREHPGRARSGRPARRAVLVARRVGGGVTLRQQVGAATAL